jgi:hypothetical protein
MTECCLQGRARKTNRAMLVLTYTQNAAEKFLKAVHSCVFHECVHRRRVDRGAPKQVYVGISLVSQCRIASRDKNLTLTQLKQNGVPSDVFTDFSVGN